MPKQQSELTDEEAALAKKLFALLLKGYERFATVSPVSAESRFVELLAGYPSTEQRPIVELTDADRRRLFEGHWKAINDDRVKEEGLATDFNLLDVLGTTYKETRHSMVLAWLLDADLRKHGTHAQRSLGFELFLQETGLPKSFASGRYWVRREVAGDEARVDIEIASRGHFLIHIENKIHAGEGNRQTDREWSDLQRRALTLGVGNPENVKALFLTPTGLLPANANFQPISWRQMAQVLEAFAGRAKPPDVKLFASHYARALRKFVVRDEMREEEN